MLQPGEPNAERPTRRPSPGRRRFLGLTGGTALLLAGGGAARALDLGDGGGEAQATAEHEPRTAAPQDALGANFNEEPRGMTPAVLDDLGTRWVRGFVPMPQLDSVAAPDQRAIKSLLSFAAVGYHTVLSLKFPYQDKPLPQPGTSAMDTELARVDKALAAVLGKVDILVIGNEPFLETRAEDRADRLNPFYAALSAHVIAERAKRCGSDCRTRLYMGALNRLEKPEWRTPAVNAWLAHVKDTPELDGVDLHPHVAALEHARQYTDYALPRIRTDQRFLATEFSLVHWWKEHWTDPIPGSYADRYGVPADTAFWEEVRKAAANPFPQERWRDLLMNSTWFASRQNHLTNQVKQFRATGRLAVATYGTLQGPAMIRDLGPDKTPWLLNSLYANLVAQRSPDGYLPHNPAFYQDFRALQ